MPTPAVELYPTRTAPDVRGRKGRVTPGRWATIKLIDVNDDIIYDAPRQEVVNISMMIPANRPPELPGLTGAIEAVSDVYFLERVADGVKIGMVRGGTIDAVGGFGFLDPNLGHGWLWFARSENGGYIALFEDF